MLPIHDRRSSRRISSLPAAAGLLGALALSLAACDGPSEPLIAEGNVAVQFQAFASVPEVSGPAAASPVRNAFAPDGSIRVEGSNGVLELTGVWMIVAEFELEGEGRTADFEARPFFVQLPLDSRSVIAATAEIPPGRYDEIEFSIENLGGRAPLLAEIRDTFLDWPRDASIRIEGSFLPEGSSEATPFVTYLDAEIEIEREFRRPFEFRETDSRILTIPIAPGEWFRLRSGRVLDLSRWNYSSDHDLLELDVEIENGVLEVEWD